MNLKHELESFPVDTRPSSVKGYEYVRGYGIFALPFSSGHVLALRVFPKNDFAPYKTVWHRTPDEKWSIYVDGPRLDTACPRYYGAAARECRHSTIALNWEGPMTLSIAMDSPSLEWYVEMGTGPLVRLVNTVSSALPEWLWRQPILLRAFEYLADQLFDLGDITLSGYAPNGHFGILMPRRMFPIVEAFARLDETDLGDPARITPNPSIGLLRLPARPVFAIGGAFFQIQDQIEYERTRAELQPSTASAA